MSKLDHSLCDECWISTRSGRPVRTVDAPEETCCLCWKPHTSGIYIRGNPEEFKCFGLHQSDVDAEGKAVTL